MHFQSTNCTVNTLNNIIIYCTDNLIRVRSIMYNISIQLPVYDQVCEIQDFFCIFSGVPEYLHSGFDWRGWWRWWGQLEQWDVQSSSQIITINKLIFHFFTRRMHFPTPNQQCQSIVHYSTGMFTLSAPGSLTSFSLTTKGSWLYWGRSLNLLSVLRHQLWPVPHK